MPFDLDRYLRVVDRLDVDDLDFDAFRNQPLTEHELRCLRYMHDVESHTTCYLRDLLNTRAHDDPEITAFLTMWNYEEFWHGEAIARVLAAHGESAGVERVASMRERLAKKRSALAPLGWMGFSAVNPHFLAVHMTFGVINEWTTQGGYARLASTTEHPVLRELLGRIMRQEGRHIDFYRMQAVARLEASSWARRTTRWIVRALWRPVGASVMPRDETSHVVTTLFGGDDGGTIAARIDRRIDALPGLEGLGLMAGARTRYAA